jgi:hypothetical protein
LLLSLQIAAAFVATPGSAARRPTKASPSSAAGTTSQGPDGAFTFRRPAGWQAQAVTLGGQPATLLAPTNGGEERIILSATPAAGSIREVAQQGIRFVLQSFPGVQPQGSPSFFTINGMPAAELAYRGAMPNGSPVRLWGGALLKSGTCYAVMAMARAESGEVIERQARTLFRTIRPARERPTPQLARALVGRWSYYYGSSSGIGTSTSSSSSVSKTVVFYPNGRFEYISGVSTNVELPSDIGGYGSGDTRVTGTYRLSGNTLVARYDGGGQATFRVEAVQGGALRINGLLFIRE